MVDILKQTREFLVEYDCSPMQARKAAVLSKAMCEDSTEILALNLVLYKRGYSVNSLGVQILKISALAIWWFTTYRQPNISSLNHASTSPKLYKEIYPLVAMVLDLSEDHVAIFMRIFAKKHSDLSPKHLILDVLDEAMDLLESA